MFDARSDHENVKLQQTPNGIWGLFERFFFQKTILCLAALLGLGLVLLLWFQNRQQKELVSSIAVQEAERYTRALSSFRTLYTREVVSTAINQQVPVTHDYNQGANKGKAIPLPATLAKSLGTEITKGRKGSNIQLFSPFPFPLPGREGLVDDFARNAWKALNESPDRPYFEFQKREGIDVIRYATADRMRVSCLNCHNTHPLSPKTDWQEGDVRGVLEVTLPLDRANDQMAANFRGFSLLTFFSALLMLGMIASTLR